MKSFDLNPDTAEKLAQMQERHTVHLHYVEIYSGTSPLPEWGREYYQLDLLPHHTFQEKSAELVILKAYRWGFLEKWSANQQVKDAAENAFYQVRDGNGRN